MNQDGILRRRLYPRLDFRLAASRSAILSLTRLAGTPSISACTSRSSSRSIFTSASGQPSAARCFRRAAGSCARVYSWQNSSHSAGSIRRFLQAVEHRVFERIAADGVPVVAGAFVAGVRAADTVGVEDRRTRRRSSRSASGRRTDNAAGAGPNNRATSCRYGVQRSDSPAAP